LYTQAFIVCASFLNNKETVKRKPTHHFTIQE